MGDDVQVKVAEGNHVLAHIKGMLSVGDPLPVAEPEGRQVSYGELFRYAKGGDKVLLALGIINAIFTGAALPAFSYIFGKLVDSAAGEDVDGVADDLAFWSMWMTIAGLLAFLTGWFFMSCFMSVGERQVRIIQSKFFESALAQEPGWYDTQRSGALTSRLHGDTKIIHSGVGEKAGLFFMHTSTVVCSYIVGFMVSWRLTLILLACAPLLVVSAGILAVTMQTQTIKARAAYEQANAVAEDTLSAIRTVHAFAAHAIKLDEFKLHLAEATGVTQKQGLALGVGMGLIMLSFFGNYAIGFVYGSYLVLWKLNSMGDLLAAFFAVVIGSFSLGQIGPPMEAMVAARAAAYRVFAIIDRKPRVLPGTAQPDGMKGHVKFNNVQFRYPSRMDNPVFTALNLDVPAGSTVGLVGVSGCGKSSIINLVQRFYEPTRGYFSRRLAVSGADGGEDGPVRTEKPYPYESNLLLLEAQEQKRGHNVTVEMELPVLGDGSVVKTAVVDLGAMTHKVVNADGKVRCENGLWFWIEEDVSDKERQQRIDGEQYNFEFKLPTDIATQLNRAAGKDVIEVDIELAVGAFRINLKQMTRTAIESAVTFTSSGDITVDGTPLGDIDVTWWRSQIGTVTQEPVLFVGTIRQNILNGKPDATDEEIHEACRIANIHHVIERWPNKYETKVGEGGCQLSGGQKQRVAIARAVINKPKVLILDEATSALDRGSEVEVQRALDGMMAGDLNGRRPTTFVIAHRLQTVKGADNIVVMKPPTIATRETGASIVETGTHDELLKKNGVYAGLWNQQTAGGAAAAAAQHSEPLDLERVGDGAEADAPPPVALTKEEEEKKKAKEKEELIKQKGGMGRVAALAKPWNAWLVPGLIGAAVNGSIYPVYAVVFTEALKVFSGLMGVKDCDGEFQTHLNRTLYQLCEDANASAPPRSDIDIWCIYFVVIGAGALLGNILQFGSFGYMGEKLTERIRGMMFEHLLRQDMAFFDAPDHETGSLSTLLTKHAQAVNNLFGPSIGIAVRIFVCLGLGFGIAFYTQWELTLVLLAGVPAMILAGAINMMIVGGTAGGEGGGTPAGQVATEAMSNIRTVASFNLAGKMIATFEAAGEGELKAALKRAVGVGAVFGFNQFAMFGTFALGLWYGGKLIQEGKADFGDVMLVVMEVTMAGMGAGEASAMEGEAMDASEAAAVIFNVLDTPPAVDQMSSDGVDCPGGGASIAFKRVTFSYPTRPDASVLKRLELDIERATVGTQVGLIGGTGSGKSTIIQLLQRFYKLSDEDGAIMIGNTNLNEINMKSWRAQIGIVSQEPSLFQTSVLDNIRLGKPDATIDEVVEVAKQAQIHSTIVKLPDGYDTLVGPKGCMLSGGQKQRVAIARAILKKPRILLLDEATSALDNESEKEVQKALDAIIAAGNMTTITIAHRLSTIRNAQSIVVLDGGNVVEKGSHDELMAKPNGEYKARYELYHALEG